MRVSRNGAIITGRSSSLDMLFISSADPTQPSLLIHLYATLIDGVVLEMESI